MFRHSVETRENAVPPVSRLLNDGLYLSDARHGKKRVQGCASRLVNLVQIRGESGQVSAETSRLPVPFVSSFTPSSVKLVVEVEVMYMKFMRVDTDDGAIFLAEGDDVEGVLASENHIIVEFIP